MAFVRISSNGLSAVDASARAVDPAIRGEKGVSAGDDDSIEYLISS